MTYFITVLVFILLITLLVFSGVRKTFAGEPITPGKTPITVALEQKKPLATENLTREQVAGLLEKLAKSPPPGNLSQGAMCYSRVAPPDRSEYVCPSCGKKTLYARNDTKARNNVDFVMTDIPECRRLVKAIKGIELKIDESQFCEKCSPGAKSPQLILTVHYPGEKGTHQVKGICSHDLIILQEFLTGKDRHAGDTGQEKPLKEYLPRLQEILGIKVR